VPAMRNAFSVESVLKRVYEENVGPHRKAPFEGLPRLLPHVCPVHELVPVDVFVPGCPPSADTIYLVLSELLEGRTPDIAGATRFGA